MTTEVLIGAIDASDIKAIRFRRDADGAHFVTFRIYEDNVHELKDVNGRVIQTYRSGDFREYEEQVDEATWHFWRDVTP